MTKQKNTEKSKNKTKKTIKNLIKMKLTIIIPVYNEQKTIQQILRRVNKVKIDQIEKEIVIIDDCSKDKSKEILRKLNNPNIKVIYHKQNQGKGAAIRTGLKHAKGDIILIQDADLEYSPTDYPKLIAPILAGKTSVVYGSRFKSTKGHLKENNHLTFFLHLAGNWGLTMLTNILFNTRITDMETCYKVFRKDVVKKMKLRAQRFDFEPEITAKILKQGHKIKEVPIRYYSRDFDEGKKITWKDGVKAAWYLIKYRFTD
jgi:glycosyltransferase involved in cell wall biosynthesis